MKQILFAVALLMTATSFSQVRGDNTIIITGVKFKEVVKLLIQEDFSIDKIDSNYQFVETEFKQLPKINQLISIHAKFKNDSTCIITGRLNDWQRKKEYEQDIFYSNGVFQGMRSAFLLIDAFGKKLQPSSLTYKSDPNLKSKML